MMKRLPVHSDAYTEGPTLASHGGRSIVAIRDESFRLADAGWRAVQRLYASRNNRPFPANSGDRPAPQHFPKRAHIAGQYRFPSLFSSNSIISKVRKFEQLMKIAWDSGRSTWLASSAFCSGVKLPCEDVRVPSSRAPRCRTPSGIRQACHSTRPRTPGNADSRDPRARSASTTAAAAPRRDSGRLRCRG